MSIRRLICKLTGFSVVGVVVTLVSMGLMFVFIQLFQWNVYVSYGLSYLLSIQLSYVLNLRYVFRGCFGWRTLWLYNMTYVGGMVLGLLLVRFYTYLSPTCNPTLRSYAAVPITFLFNFLWVNKIAKNEEHTKYEH